MNASISVKDLEILFTRLISKFKKDGIMNFEFQEDEYWIILNDEWTNFTESPVPAVGSLEDDTEFLKSVIKNEELISYLELERLSAILRAISSVVLK